MKKYTALLIAMTTFLSASSADAAVQPQTAPLLARGELTSSLSLVVMGGAALVIHQWFNYSESCDETCKKDLKSVISLLGKKNEQIPQLEADLTHCKESMPKTTLTLENIIAAKEQISKNAQPAAASQDSNKDLEKTFNKN